MNLLITNAASLLGEALAQGLRSSHQLRLSARVPVDTDLEFVLSELGHDGSTDELVAGIEAIIHLPEPVQAGDSSAWIDACTRCTYNLLTAASEAGVERFIYLSTLDLFLSCDEDMTVNERWRPRPSCEPHILGPYLGEFIAEEFAHQHALNLLCLRLGHPIRAEEASTKPFDPMWIELGDVVQAVDKALQKDLPRFALFHLQSASERARFSTTRAASELDFAPQFNFEDIP
jgi:nucleoside-diphosphate-sugar epimerase